MSTAKHNHNTGAGHRRMRGLTLVELMIALALSTMLILGVTVMYLKTSQASTFSTSVARVQDAGRVAVDMMAQDLRMSAFQGCADPERVSMRIIANNAPTTDFFASSLQGWEVAAANWADGIRFDNTAIETRAVQGSDVIQIQRAEKVPLTVTGNMSSANANIQVSGELGLFAQNDIVVITDCENADMFRITNNPAATSTLAHASGSNTDNRLSQAYDSTADIMRFRSTAWFVADTGRTDSRGQAIHALYRQRDRLVNNATPAFDVEEMVVGVENIQILYGELLTGGNIRYVPAGTAGLDMASVVAIKLALLISDVESVRNGADTSTYNLLGQSIGTAGAVTHPADHRFRRVFQTTINLRNRSNF